MNTEATYARYFLMLYSALAKGFLLSYKPLRAWICIFHTLFYSLLSVAVMAQTVDDFRYASPLFKKVDDKGKLIGGVITSGIEAENGIFWFGSQYGLMSFDGYQFRRYAHQPDNSNTPAANYIIALAQDKQGYIWLATRTSGLSRYSPREQKFIHFNTQSTQLKLRTNTLRTLRFDHQGYLWLGHELGVDKIDTEKLTITSFDFPIANSISFYISPEKDGKIIAGSTKGLFIKEVNSDKFELVEALKNIDVRSIYQAKNGNYWLGTKQGLRLWDGKNSVSLIDSGAHDLNNTYIRTIVPQSNGKVWVASYGKGLALFHEDDVRLIKQFKHDPSDDTSLAFDDVGTILLSANGTLLIGTWGGGLQLLNTLTSDSFVMMRHSLQHQHGLSFANVRTILELNDGRLLVGTTGNGLDLIDPKKGRIANIQQSVTGKTFSNTVSLAQQDDKVVWVGTASSGLLQLDLTTLTLTSGFVKNIVDDAVLRLLTLPDQSLLVGTNKGVCKKAFNSDSCTELKKTDGSLMGDTVTALVADKYNNAWISTHNGVYRLRDNSTVLDHYKVGETEASLSHNYVLGMVATQQDKMWLATSIGFDSVTHLSANKPRFKRHKAELDIGNNKPGANMLLDEQGRIWSGTSLLEPTNKRFLHFNSALGIDIGTAWLGSYTQLRSGLMAYGGTKGVLIVDPTQFSDEIASSSLLFTRFRINDEEVPLARLDQLTLSPQENEISLQIASPDIQHSQEIEYQYKLVGQDNKWRTLENNTREIHYSNLAPQHYQLQIKANYTKYSALIAPLTLSFTVQPHYWQTWWFGLVILCLLLLIVALVFRWRIGLVRAQALQLEALVNTRTHEIEVINQIGKKLTTQLLLEDLFNDIYTQLSKIFIADRFGIGLLNHERNQLVFDYAVERGVRYQSYVRDMEKTGQLAVYAVQHNQSVLINDYQTQYQRYYSVEDNSQHQLSSGLTEQAVASMMYVPMQRSGSVLGVLSIQSITKNSYSEHDLTLLETLASYASIAVENARSHQDLLALHQQLKLNIDELQQTQQQLILNEKMAYLGQLVAGVAHEINTPISIGITAASLLEDMRANIDAHVKNNTLSKSTLDNFLNESQQSLRLIQNNAERVAILVQRFKQLAEQDGDDRLKDINLAALCQSVISNVRGTMEDNALQIHLRVNDAVVIKTYPMILGQVLFILIQNAYSHAFNDKKGKVSIEGAAVEDHYVLRVIDDGCGIDTEALARIFEPFYTTKRHQGGTGLGLSIAFNLVNTTLNGQLSCQSTLGQGTVFEIKLPKLK
ncbi:sensor histidine kinase [Colwellia asteriadis]